MKIQFLVCIMIALAIVGHSSAQQFSLVSAPGSPIAVAGGPGNVAIGDVNQDGKPDLVVASGRARTITILLGQGNARFRDAYNSPVSVPDSPGEMALVDLNADRKLDLVLASHDSYGVTLLLGDGNGGFALAPNSPMVMKEGQRPHTHGLTLGDVNGDDKRDLVTTHSERSSLTVLLGNGKGSFTESPNSPFDLGHAAWRVAIVDINRDAKADVVAAADEGVRVLLGDARGSFKPAPGSPFATGKGAWRLAVGDLDGDGKHDIATSNLESDNVSILLTR